MPNQPRPDNRPHMIRVPDDLWAAARARAEERGETISDAVRAFLDAYRDGTASAVRKFARSITRD